MIGKSSGDGALSDFGRSSRTMIYLRNETWMILSTFRSSVSGPAVLRAGRFRLYDKATGKEIKESEIPWRK